MTNIEMKVTKQIIISRVFLAFFGVVVATMILLSSLLMAHSVQSSEGMEASTRAMYFDGAILPDHSAYPVIMALDRSRLLVSSPEDQGSLQLSYARRRLWYAVQLLEKGENELAVATITKSQKYVLKVAQSYLEHKDSVSRDVLVSEIEDHIGSLQLILTNFELHNASSISSLIEEEQAILGAVKATY